jgi:hypothetical protein
MSLIRTVCLSGSVCYALIFIIQAIDRRPLLEEAIAGILMIAFLSAISCTTDEHELHTGEMIMIWSCILLFALYALLRAGGIV